MSRKPSMLAIILAASLCLTNLSPAPALAAEAPAQTQAEEDSAKNEESLKEDEPEEGLSDSDAQDLSSSIDDFADEETLNEDTEDIIEQSEEDNASLDSLELEDQEEIEETGEAGGPSVPGSEEALDVPSAPNGEEESDTSDTPKDNLHIEVLAPTRTEGQSVTPSESGGQSPDDLFATYVDNAFGITGENAPKTSAKKRGARSAGANLTGINRAVYDRIASYLPAIASGEHASTVIEIEISELGLDKNYWTAEELGVGSLFAMDDAGRIFFDDEGNPLISGEAVEAALAIVDYDLKLIVDSLLADFPYQLYWYEKSRTTIGTGIAFTAWFEDEAFDHVLGTTGSISISFPVADEFAAGEYTVDTSVGQAVQTSVSNADAIVSKYSSFEDYDKLIGYKDDICELVSYNFEAASGGASYGNPWQMIWVFDGDPDTSVVCEGYAKAFKYLCDRTEFTRDISCITVTGTMRDATGEDPHMWNIVNMDDRRNYLADVTNSDAGTSGENGELFIVPFTSGSVEEGYSFRCDEETELYYAYSGDTVSIYPAKDLTIAPDPYGTIPYMDPLEITSQPQGILTELGESVSLHIETNREDAVYQWQWSADGTAWEDCALEGADTDTLNFLMQEELNAKHYRCAVTARDEFLISDEAVVALKVIASGTWGTCDWEIDGNGVLTIHAGTGAGYNSWIEYREIITEVVATEHIVLPANSNLLFSLHWADENYNAVSRCTKMDLSGLDTSNVTDMSWMFYGDSSLQSLDLSGFDTRKVTNMNNMFCECREMQTLDITGFDTSNVENMAGIFSKCWALTALDVSGFDTSKVTDMSYMFYGLRNVRVLDVSGFTTDLVTDMQNMFYECNRVTALDVSGFNTSNVTNMSCMFANCASMQALDVSGFDTSHVTKMDHMFQDCWKVPILDVAGFDTSRVTDMECMFYECHSLTELDVTGFDTSNVTNMGGLFESCYNLRSLDVTGFDTSNVTNMNYMFCFCSCLTELDLSGLNTSNVTQMINMFFGCEMLQELDLSYFDTENVTNMINMFGRCLNLQHIDLSTFDTSNVENM